MNRLMAGLLLHSLKVSVPALLLALMTPGLTKKFAAKWVYCAWLAVLLWFLLPASPPGGALFSLPLPQESRSYTGFSSAFQANVPDVPEAGAVGALAAAPVRGAPFSPLFAIWAAGAAATAGYHGLKHLRYIKTVNRWKQPVREEGPLTILEREKSGLGIGGGIELCLCPCIASPALIWGSRPAILLPGIPEDGRELSLILKHELVHYRRKDLLHKLAALAALAVHWFNPAVYLAARIADALCEISCDQAVVDGAELPVRRLYGLTILRTAEIKASLAHTLLSDSRNKKAYMEKRMEGILDMNKKRRGLAVILATAAALLAVSFAVSWDKPGEFPFIDRTQLKAAVLSGLQEGDGSTDRYIIWPEGQDGIGRLPAAASGQPFREVSLRYRHYIRVNPRDANGKAHAVDLGFDYDYRLSGEITAGELNGYIASCFEGFEEVFKGASYEQMLDAWSLYSLFQQCLDLVQEQQDPRVAFLYHPSGILSDFSVDPSAAGVPMPGTYFSSAISFHDLAETAVVIDAGGIGGWTFHTDTGDIFLSFGGGSCAGTFYLYDAADPGSCLQSLAMTSPAEREKAFTGLSSGAAYRIAGENIAGSPLLKVSASTSVK